MKVDEFLRTMVLELKDIDESELVPEAVIEELNLDSLDYVEIQVGIKKKFGVSIDPELFQSGRIKTLGDLCQYVEEQQAIAAPTTAG